MKAKRWVMALPVLLMLAVAGPAVAAGGNVENGKRLFMVKGTGGKACMTCHPRGLTTGETYKGKDIPDLTERALSESKLRRRTEKFLKVQGMALSEAELEDLLAFVRQLPDQGFGPVPPAWQGFVKSKLGN